MVDIILIYCDGLCQVKLRSIIYSQQTELDSINKHNIFQHLQIQ
jgi:hypothetical protein